MRPGVKNLAYTEKANADSGCAREQKLLASKLVNHGHGDHGCNQVCKANRHGLYSRRYLTRTSRFKDIIKIIEARIHAGELIKCGHGDAQKNRQHIFPRKK